MEYEPIEQNPAQTALLGFGKVLDMEHPEYSAVLVDVDAESDERAARAIITSLRSHASDFERMLEGIEKEQDQEEGHCRRAR